ncbi:ABC transporter [Pyrenophora tritici-repentis Pt-1C-BFP]|uniref:ABC transporter n=1 Tax=Pyrenophora tritici-repentis (strain Pt-1C-BFP) TaxID=426418 RepID=B2VWI6_PYRTR|nr:ABC transporter [Pyrenophora tritici-repentis Pt-1C-BFP]EDU40986.1 ABC transporter [Pyrenophora tritici-repentis Pt-1C-BFP]
MWSHHNHIGYCDQTAFLFNKSVRENIVVCSPFNPARYAEVIKATALIYDFATLPQGDGTNVGSDGITLFGGQKQCVSLARALYLQADLFILDDVFSGLDAETAEHVFNQVFGPNGLLRRRRTTVVLCTHSMLHLPAADHIIALGDGTVVAQTVGQLAVIPTSSAYLAISYPFLVVLLYAVQRFYLRTSRQIRQLDLEAKSPLYTHFLDTVRGIATLRAFGFMHDEIENNSRLIVSSQRPSYLLPMIEEWLNCVLNVVVIVMAVLLTTLAVRLHSKSGFAGASLYSLLTLGENLSAIVIYWTKLEY